MTDGATTSRRGRLGLPAGCLLAGWWLVNCGVSGVARGAELASIPVLKVEVGTHLAMIRRIAFDEAHDRLVTAGDDKTVRVWAAREGELIRTIHLPIGPAHEGQVNGVSISADGHLIAAGGRTGWDVAGKAWLYLIDIESGHFVGRIDDLPEIICYLTFSKSGDYLAVGLCRDKGLRVYRTHDRQLVFSDTGYRDRIAGMDFAADGRLAVTSYAGSIRLYSPTFQASRDLELHDGGQPTIVRFSPDGRRLAVGYLDTPHVTLLNSGDLSSIDHLHAALTGGPTTQGAPTDLPGVAWSPDGRFVYGYGGTDGAENSIWRFEPGRNEPPQRVGQIRGRWTALEIAGDGAMIYAGEDPLPVLGRMTAAGEAVYERRPPVQDFTDLCGRLEIADQPALRFPPAARAGERLVFAPTDHYFGTAAGSRIPESSFHVSPTSSPRLRTAGWASGLHPLLNDQPLKLDPYEIARCIAVNDAKQRVAMGSEWTLRLFDAAASMQWAIPLSQLVRSVGFSPDGRFVVAALSDGTVRWYRSDNGTEVVAALLHDDAKNWIAWTPDGYYDSSLEGDNLIGWHVNRGADAAADFFRAVQFDRLLYRPEVVRGAYRDAAPTPREVANASFTPGLLIPILPPVIDARLIPAPGVGDAYLDIDIERRSAAMQSLQIFLNGIPRLTVGEQAIASPGATALHRRVTLALPPGSNSVRVEVATPSAIGVGEAKLIAEGKIVATNADLYVLAIGVNRFRDRAITQLQFAGADAASMIATARQFEGSTFHQVHALEISDSSGSVTADRVTGALRFLDGAGPNDTVLLFLASHGISDAQGNYYFVPSDAVYADADAILNGRPTAGSLVGWTVFYAELKKLPGRRIVIIDTCQSGDFGRLFDVTSLAKRSFTSHFVLVAASKGEEESQEFPLARHGLFTYGFLKSWTEGGPAKGAGTLMTIFNGAAQFVSEHYNPALGTQTPQLVAPPPLADTVLGRRVEH